MNLVSWGTIGLSKAVCIKWFVQQPSTTSLGSLGVWCWLVWIMFILGKMVTCFLWLAIFVTPSKVLCWCNLVNPKVPPLTNFMEHVVCDWFFCGPWCNKQKYGRLFWCNLVTPRVSPLTKPHGTWWVWVWCKCVLFWAHDVTSKNMQGCFDATW